ncbi:MAG TPA: phosphatase PAP2 family protein [Rhizomicrobium sp.]|jgi:membrane-associated phospholipid phosphatase
MRLVVFAATIAALGATGAHASTGESLGSDVAIALPLIAGGISVYKDDWVGTGQLILDTGLTVGTAYGLKHIIREQRPDKSDFQSMPSDTSALAFAPAQYLWDRYGWQYGLPAYAAATFVGWSRVDADKHHWYDVTASWGLALGFSKLITTRYHARGLNYGVTPTNGGAYASLEYKF